MIRSRSYVNTLKHVCVFPDWLTDVNIVDPSSLAKAVVLLIRTLCREGGKVNNSATFLTIRPETAPIIGLVRCHKSSSWLNPIPLTVLPTFLAICSVSWSARADRPLKNWLSCSWLDVLCVRTPLSRPKLFLEAYFFNNWQEEIPLFSGVWG